jgi:hypothetical protein
LKPWREPPEWFLSHTRGSQRSCSLERTRRAAHAATARGASCPSEYRPEHVDNSRSHMHDVTHCVYATGCQQFVTNDKRLYDKVGAVYRYFDVPTQVMKFEDFLAHDYS